MLDKIFPKIHNEGYRFIAIFIIATIVLVPISGNHGLWVSYILFILLRAITLSLKFSGLQREITLLK